MASLRAVAVPGVGWEDDVDGVTVRPSGPGLPIVTPIAVALKESNHPQSRHSMRLAGAPWVAEG